ncbi:hypothetical protein P5G51_018240 [Virgibacillus sp. 179-BFC.A HS]|uniref:Uncharacterized protein n=1 Tax=Tigheibacillus jepli TaxID=3035914 RepID=A0ABU5CM93_9BACI|nr:hypothetical protein [Virgibacillus sp. 179-BFC.A HS]MDY0407021.1 hypothetical protein [Virgibacillus sp. 179-BFC.A HS]
MSKYVQLAGERFRYHPYWDLRSLLDVLSDPLEVYAGWSAFGMEITPELMQERMDNYLLKLLENV